MFVWKTKTILSQLERFLPHNFERLELIGRIWNTPDRNTTFYDEFSRLEKISIDYGVLERALNVHMVKAPNFLLICGATNSNLVKMNSSQVKIHSITDIV